MEELRAIWEYVPSCHSWRDEEISVTVQRDGVLFEVTQEQAVDSYNEHFTCSIVVPLSQVVALAAMLNTAIAMEASGRDGETRLDPKDDSAGRRHRPNSVEGNTE